MNTALLASAVLLLIPVATLLVECVLALLPKSDRSKILQAHRPRITVLVPAHNEATGIRPILESILQQLGRQDRLVVIADNCTDETAAIARSTGATVIERQDSEHRGKGYALDYGIQYLAADPPDVVVVVDADCLVEQGTLEQIARQAAATGRPVQSLYLMQRPSKPQPKDIVSALAFLVRNWVRARGLQFLGMPCYLTGTGMAFPWPVIRQASLATGNIVEDMQLGIDLAIAGYPPMFCENARVIGVLPQQAQAATSQRTRWEHGHLKTIQTQVPRLIKAAIDQKRLDLWVMALDQAIPPLSLLVLVWLIITAVALAASLLGASWISTAVLGIEGFLIFIAIFMAWARFARAELPIQSLIAVPLYLLWKIPLYFAFFIRPQTKWIRTERDVRNAQGSRN